MLTSEAAQSPKRHNMLPQVLLVLHGTSTARTSVGRRVELYHVTMKYNRGTKEAKIRYNTLRKYLDLVPSQIELVVAMMHEANAFMCRYKMPSQSYQVSSNDSGPIDHVAVRHDHHPLV
ncbi:hypothetical protein DYB26_002489 [Aphanomyces astaci]|uniref:Uncharacterized protein n=1 Tax=Aphanomyces astaci TaxID=112090 RepID=A0A397EXL1_APHAT|nr:hypothetical protein DYB36_005382 [Aphanomyces astaci]RHY62875.1 hypothetical protein DYB38_002666 [Aphanomyces astaci]RHZ07316.1 hypothetical protein DYB31_000382 [Aphanomyces astaci]RHZ26255.1 hypothetical protein DYB26_002489 [Aphanomyces astaci]